MCQREREKRARATERERERERESGCPPKLLRDGELLRCVERGPGGLREVERRGSGSKSGSGSGSESERKAKTETARHREREGERESTCSPSLSVVSNITSLSFAACAAERGRSERAHHSQPNHSHICGGESDRGFRGHVERGREGDWGRSGERRREGGREG